MVAGAVIAGTLNATAQYAMNDGHIDWTQVGVAAALGAVGVGVAGAITADIAAAGVTGVGAVALEMVGNAGAGPALAATGTVANAAIDGAQGDSDGSVNFDQFASSLGTGALVGTLGSSLGQGTQAALKNTSGPIQGAAGEISDTMTGTADALGNTLAGVVEMLSTDLSDK